MNQNTDFQAIPSITAKDILLENFIYNSI
jgi:hypothetical protein